MTIDDTPDPVVGPPLAKSAELNLPAGAAASVPDHHPIGRGLLSLLAFAVGIITGLGAVGSRS